MSSGRTGQEIEIKLRLATAAQGRRLLRRAGFRASRRRLFEDNVVFDNSGRTLRDSGMLLRIRRCGRRSLLTFKGPSAPGRHKSREELEVELRDPETLNAILRRLGFEPVFRYVKYRTEYSAGRGSGVATLDETPIGDFLELEGPPEWIDRTAGRLGFTEADYITASYASLYSNFRKQHPISSPDMIFQ